MRLVVIGGGGFRVPLVYRALLQRRAAHPEVHEVVLHDLDPSRASTISAVLAGLSRTQLEGPSVRVVPSLDAALEGADAIFCAMRVGGTAGRVRDERVALGLGVLGQETVGAGGVAYGLRTVPVALHLAQRIAARAPGAWVVNFTNPAGMVTEVMASVLGARVIGICDSPSALVRRAARAAGADPGAVRARYVGLNHLGWLRTLSVDETDLLPRLLHDRVALSGFEEGRLFGTEWLSALGSLPNEYLWYYYAADAALARVLGAEASRGEIVGRQQEDFYTRADGVDPDRALALWQETLAQRERGYFAESRVLGHARDESDVHDEGYEGVALALLGALAGRGRRELVLNVTNGTTLPFLPADAVIEVSCTVDRSGARALPVPTLGLHEAGLMAAVKSSEQAVIQAVRGGGRREVLRAFAFHPLVRSVEQAADLCEAYGL